MENRRAGCGIIFAAWIVNTIALFIVVKTIKGLNITATGMDGFWILFITAGVIGVLNAVVKPVLTLLTLPITVITLGLWILVLNAFMFALAGWIVPGFQVTSLIGAVIGSLLFSIISFTGSFFIGRE